MDKDVPSRTVMAGSRVGAASPSTREAQEPGAAGADPGVCFLWLLFFAQAKKVTRPAGAESNAQQTSQILAPHLLTI